VAAGPQLDPDRVDTFQDRSGAPDRVGLVVEPDEEAVPGVVDLVASEALDRLADDAVMAPEHRTPAPVPEVVGDLG
jgi:hypothetical protein